MSMLAAALRWKNSLQWQTAFFSDFHCKWWICQLPLSAIEIYVRGSLACPVQLPFMKPFPSRPPSRRDNRQRRPPVQGSSSSTVARSSAIFSRASYPPSAFRRSRPGQAPPILGGRGGGSRRIRDASSSPQVHIPLTVLQGWFDGWGAGDGANTPDKGGKGAGSVGAGKSSKGRGSSGGGDKARRNTPGGSGGSTRAGERGKPSSQGGGSSNIFSGLGRLGDGGKGTRSGSGGGAGQKAKGDSSSSSVGKSAQAKPPRGSGKSEVKGRETAEEGRGGSGAIQTLAAVGESFTAGAAAFQDRFSEIGSQNVSFILPAGKVANLTVPWKGVGIYAGGLLSGLAVAVGLLTVPYTELGSPGLRKSLTLFENVLVDIDQV